MQGTTIKNIRGHAFGMVIILMNFILCFNVLNFAMLNKNKILGLLILVLSSYSINNSEFMHSHSYSGDNHNCYSCELNNSVSSSECSAEYLPEDNFCLESIIFTQDLSFEKQLSSNFLSDRAPPAF